MDTPLLERSEELARVDDLFAAAKRGEGRIRVVTAAAGIGKTRLLREAAVVAETQGLRTLWASAREVDRDLPFGVVRELLGPTLKDGAGTEAQPLFEGAAGLARSVLTDSVAAAELGGQLYGLYWLLANLAERGPVCLIIDDVHWADEQSLRWLAHICERVADIPVAVLIAVRRGEPGNAPEVLAELLAHPQVQHGEPLPLSPRAVEALVSHRFSGEVDSAFSEACFRVTGGNAFYVNELTTALRLAEVEPGRDGVSAVEASTPDRVSRRLRRRIERHGAAAIAVTETLAVLGDGTSIMRIKSVAGLGEDELATAIDRLVESDILEVEGRVRFSHAIVRQAVLRDIGKARLELLHRRAVEIYTEAGESADLVAPHLLHTEPADLEQGVQLLTEAAQAATNRGAPAVAATFLDRAVDLSAPAPEELTALRARTHAMVGSPNALNFLIEASETAPEVEGRIRLGVEAARCAFNNGDVAQTVELLRRSIADAEKIDGALAREIKTILVGAQLVVPGMEVDSGDLIDEIEGHEPGATPGERAMLAAKAVHMMMNLEGNADQALTIARRAWAGGELLKDEGPNGLTWSFATGAMAAADAYGEEISLLDDVLALARSSGSIYAYATASYCRCCPLFFRGDIEESLADAMVAIDARREGWQLYLSICLAFAANAHVELGDRDAAKKLLADVEDVKGSDDSFLYVPLLLLRAEFALVDGDIRQAMRLIDEARSRFGAIRSPHALTDWRRVLAEVEVVRGDLGAAQELLAEQLELVRPWGAPRIAGDTLRRLGEIQGGDRGLAATGEAVGMLRGSEVRLGLGYALASHGRLLLQGGYRGDAESALLEGLEVAAQCGSVRLETRIREDLSALGRRPRRTARRGPDALTASERRVVGRAASGMTNREIAQELFITTKTVEKHLANSYRKLGISSRRDLATTLVNAKLSA